MEKLQEQLVKKIEQLLQSDEKDIQLLDVLNRLFGTVSNWLLDTKK